MRRATEPRLTWIEGCVKSLVECLGPKMLAAAATNLVLLGTLDILLVVEIHQLALGAVDDIRNGKPVQHDFMMVTMIVREKDALAFFVVGGGEAFSISEVVGGKFFDRAFGTSGHPTIEHSWRHDLAWG